MNQQFTERILTALIAAFVAAAIVTPAAAQDHLDPSARLPQPKAGRQLLAPPRLWKTADGKFEVLAGLVEIDGEQVVLKRADNGYIARVSFDLLSPEDIEFVRNFRSAEMEPGEEPAVVPDLLPPPMPQTELAESRLHVDHLETFQSGMDIGFRKPVDIAGVAIGKASGVSPDRMRFSTADIPREIYRQFADGLESHVSVVHRIGNPELFTSQPVDPLPNHDLALSVPRQHEIRLKPPVSESGVDVSVVADLVRDSRISLNPELKAAGKGTLIRFQLKGRDANQVFRAGELVLSELQDTKGLSLGIRGTQPRRNGLNGAWTPVDASSRSCSVELTIPEGEELEGLSRLKGEFKVHLVTTYKTFTLPVSGESAEGKAIKDDHGISVFIRKDERSIVLETSGNVLDVEEIWLEGVEPGKITPSSDLLRRTGWYQFDCREDFPPDVQVKIKVVTGIREIIVPFEFDSVSYSDPLETMPR